MSTRTPGIHPTPSLTEVGATDRAIIVLRAYFAPFSDPAGPPPHTGYTGGRFDTFDPTGTRAADVDVFTADDLVAVTLLSVEVSGRAAIDLLDRRRAEFTELLRAIGPDRDLVDVDTPIDEDFPATKLNRRLRTLPGIGATKASKLIARKRSRLIPVYDTVINEHLLHGSGRLWEPLRCALKANDRRLQHHLITLREAAGLSEQVSPLRILDVLAWMDGTGYADEEVARHHRLRAT